MEGAVRTWGSGTASTTTERDPAGHPDVVPTAEALQLLDLFRESARLPESKDKGGDFLKEMASAENRTRGLYESMAKHARNASPHSLSRGQKDG